MRDNGLLAQPLKTNFGKYKPFVTSSKSLLRDSSSLWSRWFYDWRYPEEPYAGFLKDVKTGIFVDGFNGELVVAATMEVENERANVTSNYSDKKVHARHNFWAVSMNYGYPQGTKLNNLTQTKTGFEAAPLNGVVNASDGEWTSKNTFTSTKASPYMIIKTAAGDFNDNGFVNEIAMLTADKKEINFCVYQIKRAVNDFAISAISDVGRIYSYSNPDYITSWSYNAWNRMPGAEILAGDFDGDGRDEIVFTGYESELQEFFYVYDYRNPENFYDYNWWYYGKAEYQARPCLCLIKIASDGKLNPLDKYDGTCF